MSPLKLPIRFFNRYSKRVETEAIYGETFLRWAYETGLGKLTVEGIAKRIFFSAWYGWRMNRAKSRAKIIPFIKTFGLDISEFAKSPADFQSFNEFFSRKLKPDSRPIDPNPNSIVFPADGRHLGFENLEHIDGVFVKGQKFDLEKLFQNRDLTKRYQYGSAVLSRLCPIDYHRFHFVAEGIPEEAQMLGAQLYSVNPLALRSRLAYLWQNKRALTKMQTARFGQVLIVEFGATNVGSISQTYLPNQPTNKGQEKGYFAFGASAVMIFFEPHRIHLAKDLLQNSKIHRELYAKMGDVMGWQIGRSKAICE